VRRWTRRQRRERAEQFLDLVGLHAHRHARPDQLSGGQQQRVALARALVFEPDLLLLDEPLSALDRNLRKQMQDELKRVHAEIGTTFIYVTHDQDEALAMSDRIAIFDHGRILQTGAPEDVYRQPANRFVAQFLGDTNILQLRVGEANGTTGVIGDVTVRLPAAGAMPLPRAGTVTLSLRPENVAVMADRTAAQPYANALPGRITGRTYRGSTEDLRVELDAGPAIQALQTTPCRGEARLAEGAACWVCWDADHAYLLDDPEAIGTPGGDAQNHHTDTEVYHVARRSA
jgi:putative spermidine/putrescine transport system ATP-binding protein